MRVIGIDVGSRHLDAVALDGMGRVTDIRTFAAADAGSVVDWVGPAAAVAIDSPDDWSTAPHATDATLSPKFRTARCAEIGLARDHGIWVPWTTPVTPQTQTWISAGIDLFAALRAAGHDPVEVYPHGVFCVLDLGRRPPPKRTGEGRETRLRLLDAAGVSARWHDMSTHDAVDATAAALVARCHAEGDAIPATCGHDGSAIWLPTTASAGSRVAG
ncbi:MAG TPA: DUF429 domain-containing protein [Acidimicrobiales bacterium]|nr:DUF429 domain-containing protein [Acidimicrobiales bacterium]